MGLVDFTLEEHVALVTLNDRENRFNPPFLSALLETLDRIEADTAATTLVVRSSHDKIFSNGIDLEWLQPLLLTGSLAEAKPFFYQLNRVFKRLVTYPLLTLAAITGHAFGGGAILACAFDFRFMRVDRGFFCLPEVDISIPFLPGMNALLASAIPAHTLREMQLTGIRLGGEACQKHHIVRQALPLPELMPAVMAYAKQINKKRPIVAEIKARANRAIVETLDVSDVAYIESGKFLI
jgi:enoyl-CoA hydratase/carnithine racemase